MRLLTAIAFALLLSVVGLGQTIPTPVPATVFNQSINVQDGAGSLVILDFGAFAGATGIGRPFTRTPKLRVTVLRPSATDSVVYDGGVQFIGTGQRAICGVLTTTTPPGRNLIAIITTQSLPATASGFPSSPWQKC